MDISFHHYLLRIMKVVLIGGDEGTVLYPFISLSNNFIESSNSNFTL